MAKVSANSTVLPAGGGPFELSALSIGVFLCDQPTHRLSVGSSRKHHVPLKKQQGWILPADSNGICEYDEELELALVSLDTAILQEFGVGQHFEFDAIVGEIDPLLLSLSLSAAEFGSNGTLYRETMQRALAAHVVQTIKPLPKWNVGIGDARMRKVLDCIHDNLGSDLSLASMAALAAMSATHFSKAFKKQVGTSPLQYVIEARLNLASVLLKTTEQSVAEIAWRVGYQDLSRFGQHFKRKFGVTPAAFRAQ